MSLLISYGCRPEWLKIKPLINVLNKNNFKYKTLFTGQHQDLIRIEKNIIWDYNFNPENGENRLDSIIQACMNKLGNIVNIEKNEYNNQIKYIMVQGDTTSALGVALSAFHHNIKVIHLEAGLRSFNNENPYPEEVNRRIISQIASIHLCPTKENYENLINEKILGDKYVVGNTALDNLLEYKDKINYKDIVLVTLHRRENHDIINKWFIEINKLAEKYDNILFILPLHPNPNVQKYKDLLMNVEIVKPLDHKELLNILVKCKLVITDSGGLQEECSFLQKKCLVCRKVTERPEALETSSRLIISPENLEKWFDYIIDGHYEILHNNCPFGDGYASEKIYKILEKYYNER